MSKLITNTIRHTGGSADNITLDNSQNVTIEGNATVDGQLKTDAIRHTGASSDAITLASDGTATAKITNNLSNRNKIINGAMTINQRNHSGAQGHNAYGLDRWKYNRSANAEFNIEQSTESPDGFAKSLQVDCTTASASMGTTDYVRLRYHIEGQDLQDFAKGTSSAKKFALSFYAKSSVTGDYAIAFYDGDNSRMCTTTYTVSDTNWNRYEIIIPADTTGAFTNDNNSSLTIWFWFVVGSNHQAGSAQNTWGAYAENALGKGHTANLGSNTSNNFYLTGVQLEASDYCTDFEHRSYADELVKCHRYYWKWVAGASYNCLGVGWAPNSSRFDTVIMFPQTMRASPSFYTGGSFRASTPTTTVSITPSAERTGNHTAYLRSSSVSGLTSGEGGEYGANNDGGAYVAFDAEL